MRNHLFIGLGGQGGNTIAALQKVFASRQIDSNALSDKGTQWDFLYIDSSKDVSNYAKNWTHFGKDLTLSPSSFLYLKDQGTSIDPDAMALWPNVAPWIGDVKILRTFLDGTQGIQGANQRRRLGRLLFAQNSSRIRKAVIEDKVHPMLSNGNLCAFHIFASLAGGTGSGCIIDLVTQLRTEYPDARIDGGFPIFLYLYVTDREFENAQVGYFHQNQAATLRDLNALCCGRFRPHVLSLPGQTGIFTGDEPISQILLSSNLTNGNQEIALEEQHQVVAEAAFERIFSYTSGYLDTGEQKALTGEDKNASFPGEPARTPLRSYRFGSLGMRRWEVPIEKIKELISRDLGESVFRKLLFQNWSPGLGYLVQPYSDRSPGFELTLIEISQYIDSELVKNSDLPKLNGQLNNDVELYHEGAKRTGFKDLDLETYEAEIIQRYQSSLGKQGVESIFHNFAATRPKRTETIRNTIHSILTNAAVRAENALGMSYMPAVLDEAQTYLRNVLAGTGNPLSDADAPRSRMDLRKAEWEKLTIFSRPLKQRNLIEAHRRDILTYLRQDLKQRVDKEDALMLEELIKLVGSLSGEYSGASSKLISWLDETAKRRDHLDQDLITFVNGSTNSGPSLATNKAEVSLNDLSDYRSKQRLARPQIDNLSFEIINHAILDNLGEPTLSAIGKITEGSEKRIKIKHTCDTLLYQRSEHLHQGITVQQDTKSVLTGNILDILEQRHQQDPAGFKEELRLFIKSATCSLALAGNELQPSTIRQDPNLPAMPREAMVIGLPKDHPFAHHFATLIKPLVGAGDAKTKGVYYHDDPTQIRLLSLTYWMAARFARVVHGLEHKYSLALSGDTEGDKRYFTNIDSSGETGSRPDLLLPSPAQYRETMMACLWLGSNLPAPLGRGNLIENSGDRLFLVTLNQQGDLSPVEIGDQLNPTEPAADITTVAKVSDAIEASIANLDKLAFDDLRSKVKTHGDQILNTMGAVSEEYRKWTPVRDRIVAFLRS